MTLIKNAGGISDVAGHTLVLQFQLGKFQLLKKLARALFPLKELRKTFLPAKSIDFLTGSGLHSSFMKQPGLCLEFKLHHKSSSSDKALR